MQEPTIKRKYKYETKEIAVAAAKKKRIELERIGAVVPSNT